MAHGIYRAIQRMDALADRPWAEMPQYIYDSELNPYCGYRRPGEARFAFGAGLIDGFKPVTRR